MSNCKYNCSSHPSEIQPYGDVAGIGVMVAFISTAWIVVFLLIIYYMAAFNPELDPFRKKNEQTPTQYPNHIDFSVLRLVRLLPNLFHIRRSNLLQSSRLEPVLNKCVIALSDIQIFTGISILVSGYIALFCGLSAYHWQLIVYLAWLANITHLATLSFLRNYFANRPVKLLWRVVLMFAMLLLLSIAVGLTGHFDWEGGLQKPADFAVCYFRMLPDTQTITFESMVKMICLLAYGFSIRMAKMFKGFETSLRQIGAITRTISTRRQRGGGQSISEVYWVVFALIWGTKRLSYTRKLGPKEENEWSFGQTLPLVLLLAPLAAIIENLSYSSQPREREHMRQSATNPDSPDRPEFEDNDVNNIDREYVASISYHGAFCLAAFGYIQAGVFFVVDDLRASMDNLFIMDLQNVLDYALEEIGKRHCSAFPHCHINDRVLGISLW
ncbi:hypothetical protein FPHYL_10223 [Fusarium phyllophilum]|uniref:Uncharacterized protein n=1 Tax=Fusarium phyllophilum TaxID=47803 RepID=A0A8H5J234_9HYPO|nr:hypothetical protein FPHYL_10223 [Fusarium phyllophilum]